MTYQLLDDDGRPIDAHLDVEGREIVFHSGGGTRGQRETRNTKYSQGLRLILERLASAKLAIEGAWVDSSRVQQLSLEDRAILGSADAGALPAVQFRRLSTRMKDVARTSDRPGGNSTKRIRLRIEPAAPNLVEVLKLNPTSADFRSDNRLPADVLQKVTAEHIWRAVQRLLTGEVEHGFGASTDFDLIVEDDRRLPPKAVFGLAASDALGFGVLPKHFTGGIGTPAFRALEAAGYHIVPKGDRITADDVPLSDEDRTWCEGNPRFRSHLRRERAAGLSKAKKAQFIREHGKLFCERCELDPVGAYGENGSACIEAHHARVSVEGMGPGHKTKLEDLQCLCANCHRLAHAELRQSQLYEQLSNASPMDARPQPTTGH